VASKFYQKDIVEGRLFLAFAIIFALTTRVIAYFSFDSSVFEPDYSGGYLWDLISFVFDDTLASVVGSALSVGVITFLLSFINGKFILIRKKTFLPAAFALILFSIHPAFMFMGAYYIGVIFVLFAILYLFQSYQTESKQKVALNTSFLLALGSLFYFNLLFYFIVFWIGLAYIRSFGFKPFLAFIIGLVLIYTPVYACSYIAGNADLFFLPFTKLASVDFKELPCFEFSADIWIVLAFEIFLLLIFLINNYINSYKDKIKIRTFMAFLSVVCVFAILYLLFFNVDAFGNLYIYTGVGSLLFAHYFSLSEHRVAQVLFYIVLVFSLSATVVFFYY
jgi:hypothetical protein